jgi:hypothetical protein
MGKLDQFLEWFHDGRESEYDKILIKNQNSIDNFLLNILKKH